MRRKIIAGNWKMHGSRQEVERLADAIKKGVSTLSSIDVIVFPSLIHIPLIEKIFSNTTIAWGAQNFYPDSQGAFTGEVSVTMLKEYGCRYVLVGHSERRLLFHEDLTMVAKKFKAAQDHELLPILCVGETKAQREKKETEKIIHEQIESVIEVVGIDALKKAVIAYEPVWAIGTGLTATPEEAQAVHHFIREKIAKEDAAIAKNMPILYGGSVKADNAAGLFSMPDIDGGLIGGASLIANDFLTISRAA